jgi:hypothetical protein
MFMRFCAEIRRSYEKHQACSHFDEHNVNGQEKRLLVFERSNFSTRLTSKRRHT